ncbi:MAG: DUF6326 family protein [Corynebacterium casei]|nr:DUF6326 family protein [Corynebacterium casei]
MSRSVLEDMKVNIKIKLSALWAAVTLCYLYGDYFGLYKPGALQSMLDGQMGPLGPATQGVLVGTSLLMAVPSVMVFLSLVLTPNINRWMNIVLGVLYTLIMIVTLRGEWAYYILLGVIEITLTLLVVAHAWRWPSAVSCATT